jgi:peptidyl-prolyl cis-trans isomerase C
MLREEYVLAFGERVQIRHIQVSSLAAVTRVKAALEKGGDFAAVARETSENQITGASGGLMPAFTRNEADVPPLIRETAFGMKPGEVSAAVQVDNWYHIIKLERQFPPSGVSFDNTDHEALKKRLLERLTRQRQETLEVELFRSAHVDIRDAGLAKRFKAKHPR